MPQELNQKGNVLREIVQMFFIFMSFIAVMAFSNATATAKEEGMNIFFDHDEIRQLVYEGGKVSQAGAYHVWIWAKNESSVRLEIAGLKSWSKPKVEEKGKFSWVKMGTVELERDKTFNVALDIDMQHSYFDYQPEYIGQMVLSLDEKFHPKRGFELMRLLTDSAGPVDDRRLTAMRSGDTAYTFPTYRTKGEWLARAEDLRHHILVSNGLYPLPEKTPLKAKIFGKIEHADYTIEKVYFESYPGFLVTGNLYRPKGKKGPFPCIANPHGHWGNGRLENSDSGSIPGRCINFAKQGYVAFAYDMVGYNDSTQIKHSYGGHRETIWGLSLMGLHLWNSIRVVDFLCSLPQVDPNRIACTGASGGGTQTFMLMGIDDRIKVSAPVNMISAHMQGGCLCENSPNLRLDTYNVEIAALMAPRPMIMISATGDWTKNTPQVEYPAVKSVYELFDAGEKLRSVQIDAGHNYNEDSREAVYAWFGKWLLGSEDENQFKEQPFELESKEQLLVFGDSDHPRPEVNAETLTNYFVESAKKQLERMKPKDKDGLEQFGKTMATALRHSLAAEFPQTDDIVVEAVGDTKREGFTASRMFIGQHGKGDRIPSVLYVPDNLPETASATLVVHPDGKAALVDTNGAMPGELVSELLKGGQMVFAIDPFLTGEYNTPFAATHRQDVRYFTTFNRTTTALRVQDILTALAYLQAKASTVNLVGLDKAGLWCLLARGLSSRVEHTVVDVAQFDNEDDESFVKELFVPSIRRAGDFRTAATLTAPGMLAIHNTADRFKTDWITDIYQAIDAAEKLRIEKEQADAAKILAWLGN